MTFRVRPLRRAREDVEEILDWMIHERQAPQGAAAWLHAYEKALDALADSAERNGLAPEDVDVDYTLRQFFFKTRRGRMYRGIYTIEGDEVLVLRVRGPGQAPVSCDDL